MNPCDSPILVLGASGFIGTHVTAGLLGAGYRVRGFDQRWDRSRWRSHLDRGTLEICEGSVFDEDALRHAMRDVSQVFNFLSFSVPSTSPASLHNELQTTVQAMDLLLSAMVHNGVGRLVYPSSGGAIYGDPGTSPARETDPLCPLSSYGTGKLLCEEMIRFYGRVHGLKYLILRVSNAYGSPSLGRVTQGVVDVFLEKVMAEQPLKIWGSPDNVRDYVFIDDLVDAVLKLLELDDNCSRVVNVGSGEPVSVREIITTIARIVGYEPPWSIDRGAYGGVSKIVLDTSQLGELTGWKPRYRIQEGIERAWRRKLALRAKRAAA